MVSVISCVIKLNYGKLSILIVAVYSMSSAGDMQATRYRGHSARDHFSTTCLVYSCLNVFFVSSASSGGAHLKLLSDVAQAVKGQGTIAWVNCG